LEPGDCLEKEMSKALPRHEEYRAGQHQDVDRAVVGESSEGSGGSFTVEEDRP